MKSILSQFGGVFPNEAGGCRPCWPQLAPQAEDRRSEDEESEAIDQESPKKENAVPGGDIFVENGVPYLP